MSGRYGRLAMDAVKPRRVARDFGTAYRLRDGDSMKWGTCDIRRKGDRYHVHDGDRRLKGFDNLAEAKGYVEDRARRGDIR